MLNHSITKKRNNMSSLFSILLKISLSLALFYLLYWTVLRKETFFRLNRFYLIFTLLISILLPLFPLYYEVAVQAAKQATMLSMDNLQNLPALKDPVSESIRWHEVVLIVYITVAALILFRLVVQSLVIASRIFKSRIKKMDGLKIVENDKYGLPFSFFNLIFINPKFHKQNDLQDILNHERVHIDQNHWVDLLIIELLTVIFWFNPFIWLFERSIKQNHEYLADQGVLTRGLDLKRYQALLINQLMGMQIIGVTNNLNFALNTNRLKMMTQSQSKKIKSAKILLALPVLFLLLAAFAEPKYKIEPLGENPEIPATTSSAEGKTVVKGTVKTTDGTPLPGTSIVLKGTSIGTMTNNEGKFSLEVPATEECSLVASFVGYASQVNKLPKPLSEGFSSDFTMKREQIGIGIDDLAILKTPPPPPPPLIKKSPDTKESDAKEKFVIVEELPSYPGGFYGLAEYYLDMKKKTKEKYASDGKTPKGEAFIGFTVDSKGKVTNIKVVKSDNEEITKFGQMVVSNMKDWNPGKQRGKAVPVDYFIAVDLN